MPIAFYNLTHANYAAMQRYTCRLLDKAYRQSEHCEKIFVLCNHEQDAAYLDELLWTYNDIAFTPHCLANNPSPISTSAVPIRIGWKCHQAQQETILVNMSEITPENYRQFNRIIEFVIAENSWRSKSREKYRFYKSHGNELVVYDIMPL